MKILVINSGSSSIKYRLFDMPRAQVLLQGSIEQIGEANSKVSNHHEGLSVILTRVDKVDAIGHRVVHGGEFFKKPSLIDDKVIKVIESCCALAPLHNPANLEGIQACFRLLPGVKQAAVFDTAFHQTIPDYAFLYALPFSYYEELGVRRYGFHGTSHNYVTIEAAKILKKPVNKINLITCHLGNGCSIAAVKGGVSIDTSMGFTPLEGLVMGTRCGDIDPALITFLMRAKNLSPDDIDKILNKESGLKGISGVSNDIRQIDQAVLSGNRRAELASLIFTYRVRKYVGAYMAVIGRVDAVVFTAGIGQHHVSVRRKICEGMFNNLKRKPRILVIPTDEELMIARETYKLVK